MQQLTLRTQPKSSSRLEAVDVILMTKKISSLRAIRLSHSKKMGIIEDSVRDRTQ